jgi:hypothetical protein
LANEKKKKFGRICWCTHQFLRAPAPRRLEWGRPRLEVRRLPRRRTTGDSLSPTSLLFVSALSPPRPLLPFSLLLLAPLSSPIPHSPHLSSSVARAPFPLHLRRRRISLFLAAAVAASTSEAPDSVLFLGCLSFRRREAPGGARRRPPAFAEVIFLELEQFFLSCSGNFFW